jgi:hypothetical protein
MKAIIFSIFSLFSFSSFAHIKLKAEILLDKETILLDQEVSRETPYTFTASQRLINIFLPATNEVGVHTLKFKVFKREGADLKAEGSSEIKVKDDQEATMSIEDKKTKIKSVIKVKIQMVKG